ncbi:hypothetical protein AAG570_004707 [Ranatra chinensis]|uniref:PHD-type domain-containing protein n=1 Tax=Ranatra chinensis TaxID=642074 RepID=A0ABD0Y1Q6_9HEMI
MAISRNQFGPQTQSKKRQTHEEKSPPVLLRAEPEWPQPPRLTPCTGASIECVGQAEAKLLFAEMENSAVEKAFNRYWSLKEPHCALCVLFTQQGTEVVTGLAVNWKSCGASLQPQIPDESRVTAWCSDAGPSGTSPLVVCSVCAVCVHSVCYSSTTKTEDSASSENWTCDKCSSPEPASAKACTLCGLRGGALKKCPEGWVHLQCVVFMPASQIRPCDIEKSLFNSFMNKHLRLIRLSTPAGPVLKSHRSASRYPIRKRSYRCTVCDRAGGTIACCEVVCGSWYHVTCATVVGVRLCPNLWAGVRMLLTCLRHPHRHDKHC